MNFWALAAGAMCFFLTHTLAQAAEIDNDRLPDGTPLIFIVGDLEFDDTTKFQRVSANRQNVVVVLSSFGGSTVSAIEIGKLIRVRGYATYVPNDTICTSSCALIWLAGTPRFLESKSKIGFHASYTRNGKVVQESGVGNALVGRYLTLLNLSERAVIFVTSAPPDKISWIHPEVARYAGIEFSVPLLEETPRL
jgi:hypothetical protein